MNANLIFFYFSFHRSVRRLILVLMALLNGTLISHTCIHLPSLIWCTYILIIHYSVSNKSIPKSFLASIKWCEILTFICRASRTTNVHLDTMQKFTLIFQSFPQCLMACAQEQSFLRKWSSFLVPMTAPISQAGILIGYLGKTSSAKALAADLRRLQKISLGIGRTLTGHYGSFSAQEQPVFRSQ